MTADAGVRRLGATRRRWSEAPPLIEVVVALTVARLVVLLPLRRYARLVGHDAVAPEPEGTAALDAARVDAAGRVRWAVGGLSQRLPGPGVCLAQALAAKWCLGRRGVTTTSHLGVLRRCADGRIDAHATGVTARRASTPLAAYT